MAYFFSNGGVPMAPCAVVSLPIRPALSRPSTRSWEIFETVEFDFETLCARFQQMAFLNKGLTITPTDEREKFVGDEVTDEEKANTPQPRAREC